MIIPTLKTCCFEASEDIITKFKSQALHILKIKYWKASGSGNPPFFISALRKIAISGIKTKFYVFFWHTTVPTSERNQCVFKQQFNSSMLIFPQKFCALTTTACSKISKYSLTVSKAEWRSIKRSWSSWTCLSSKSVAENWVLSKKIEKIDKGQLILKCPFGVFKSSKKTRKFFPGFLP